MQSNEYQSLSMRTKPESDSPIEDMIHASFGLATETGEFVDIIKRQCFYRKPIDVAHVEEELGDILWYISLAASANGLQLGTIMEKNVAKLAARYPDKFTEEKAIERDVIAERDAMDAA